jgi:DNA-directed RNA polymerase specialized sigma24 family protein
LPECYWSVINLIDLYEFDYSEAACILKIPLGTLKTRLIRARLQMKGMLQISIDLSSNDTILEACPTSAEWTVS